MKSVNRVISLVVIFCFLLNNATSYSLPKSHTIDMRTGTGKLAPDSCFKRLVDIENKNLHKDLVRLEYSLQYNLKEKAKEGAPLQLEDLRSSFGEFSDKEHTDFNPANMQFFFNEAKQFHNGWFYVMCRIWDEGSSDHRTYHAVFSPYRDRLNGFSIEVYKDEEWPDIKKIITLREIIPRRKEAVRKEIAEDGKAVERGVRHEGRF